MRAAVRTIRANLSLAGASSSLVARKAPNRAASARARLTSGGGSGVCCGAGFAPLSSWGLCSSRARRASVARASVARAPEPRASRARPARKYSGSSPCIASVEYGSNGCPAIPISLPLPNGARIARPVPCGRPFPQIARRGLLLRQGNGDATAARNAWNEGIALLPRAGAHTYHYRVVFRTYL